MPQVKVFLECLGLALCDKARKAFFGTVPFGEVLPDVAKATLDNVHKQFTTSDFRSAISQTLALEPAEYRERLVQMIDGLTRVQAVPFKAELADYLRHFPSVARRFLSRPSDVNGTTVPEAMSFFKPEELMILLPPHRPTLRIGHEPEGLAPWKLRALLGVGATAETWLAENSEEPGQYASLKFAVESESRTAVVERQELFQNAFKLAETGGVVPLTSVYLETDPPALESPYVGGYDLASLMWDWRWKYNEPKPEAALKLMRRLCDIMAKAHALGVVHRNLKPSNIRLLPGEGGRFSLWITDFGWSQISAERALHLSRNQIPRGEQLWLALRGAHTPLYASPQQVKKEPADPRDDVYALGVIWYQLLRRDPHVAAPVGSEWADELHAYGVNESQSRLLNACLSTRPEKRPKNTRELAELLGQVTVGPNTASLASNGTDGSKLIPIKGHTTALQAAIASSKASAPVITAQVPGIASLPRMIVNSVGLSFMLLPPGRIKLGSPDTEAGRREHEGPVHEVVFKKPMYMGVHPVTQAQFERVMGKNPSTYNKGHGGGPDHPVEGVTFDDARRFCDRLAKQTDEELNTRLYRLPTEAEWEYACRAGTPSPYCTGDKLTGKDAQYANPCAFGKSGKPQTAPVGRCPANPFGLFDFHGNVYEWVNDWYDEYFYHDCPAENPEGPPTGTMKVVRGGCYTSFANDCRSAARRSQLPGTANGMTGFRVMLVTSG